MMWIFVVLLYLFFGVMTSMIFDPRKIIEVYQNKRERRCFFAMIVLFWPLILVMVSVRLIYHTIRIWW